MVGEVILYCSLYHIAVICTECGKQVPKREEINMAKEKGNMKKYSDLFLRAALFAMGGLVLFLCVLMFSAFTDSRNAEFKQLVTGLYAAAIPFFYALYQAWKLLDLIKENKAFTGESVRALGTVSYCGAIIAVVLLLVSPFFYDISQREDAPGVFAICLMIVFMSVVIAVFTGVLQKLFQNAVDIKSENDLTV
jgi:hypothetical protein